MPLGDNRSGFRQNNDLLNHLPALRPTSSDLPCKSDIKLKICISHPGTSKQYGNQWSVPIPAWLRAVVAAGNQVTDPLIIFQRFPPGDGSKTQENFMQEFVFYLTLRIKVIYSLLSRKLAQGMTLTSAGSHIRRKSTTVPGNCFFHEPKYILLRQERRMDSTVSIFVKGKRKTGRIYVISSKWCLKI